MRGDRRTRCASGASLVRAAAAIAYFPPSLLRGRRAAALIFYALLGYIRHLKGKSQHRRGSAVPVGESNFGFIRHRAACTDAFVRREEPSAANATLFSPLTHHNPKCNLSDRSAFPRRPCESSFPAPQTLLFARRKFAAASRDFELITCFTSLIQTPYMKVAELRGCRGPRVSCPSGHLRHSIIAGLGPNNLCQTDIKKKKKKGFRNGELQKKIDQAELAVPGQRW